MTSAVRVLYYTHLNNTHSKANMFTKIAHNTLARAVLRYNKKREVYKMLVAFNVTERDANGNYKFPVQQKCNYVSGDLNEETLVQDLGRALALAKRALSTDNIEIVG